MYGFTRDDQFPKGCHYIVFKHDIFKKGNEINFCQIRRSSKNRAIKIAETKFNDSRADIKTTIESDTIINKRSQSIILDLILYKDQTQKILR